MVFNHNIYYGQNGNSMTMKKTPVTIFYFYDFKIGMGKSLQKKNWREQNLKLAARNPVHALYMYDLLLRGSNSHTFKNLDFCLKGKDMILMMQKAKNSYGIKRVIEYKITNTNGRTQVRYKRSQIYCITSDFKIRQTDM